MKIFDIGTNRGHFTDEYLNLYPEAEIVCIEPNPKLCEELVEKYKNNPNIKVYHYLVSDKSNMNIDFYIPEINDWDAVSTANIDWVTKSRFNHLKWKSPIKVESITLDELIDNTFLPDILKIDVEGYEANVINGFTKKVELVQFEWAIEAIGIAKYVCEYLKTIGYNQFSYKFEDQPYTYIPQEFCDLENLELFKNISGGSWGMVYAKY